MILKLPLFTDTLLNLPCFKALIYGGKSPYGDNVSAKQNVITRTNFRPEQPPSWIAEPKDPGNEVLS